MMRPGKKDDADQAVGRFDSSVPDGTHVKDMGTAHVQPDGLDASMTAFSAMLLVMP